MQHVTQTTWESHHWGGQEGGAGVTGRFGPQSLLGFPGGRQGGHCVRRSYLVNLNNFGRFGPTGGMSSCLAPGHGIIKVEKHIASRV